MAIAHGGSGERYHSIPVFPGMTPHECWDLVIDAGYGVQVPEFQEKLAAGEHPIHVEVVADFLDNVLRYWSPDDDVEWDVPV